MVGLLLLSCASSVAPAPVQGGDTAAPSTGGTGTPQQTGTADTGPVPTTADTAPSPPVECEPIPSTPPFEVPLLPVPPLNDFGYPGQSEYGLKPIDVFIVGQMVGFTWDDGWSGHGAMWWHHSFLPQPTEADRVLQHGMVYAPGDVTADGIDDLRIGVSGSEFSDGQSRIFYAPGPIGAYADPIWDQPGVLEFIPQWASGVPSAPSGRSFRCGDIDGDGIGDTCGTVNADFGPVDLQPDFAWQSPSSNAKYAAADLDGDGANEIYAAGTFGLQRFRVQYAVPTAAAEVYSGPEWTGPLGVADLDGDGADALIVWDWQELRRIDDAAFVGGTSSGIGIVASGLDGPVERILAGDFDGDGQQELAVGRETAVHIFEADGTERVRIEPDPSTSVVNFGDLMDAGDVDANGIDDLVIGAPQSEFGSTYVVLDPLCAG